MEPFLGQIQAFGFNFAPRGWTFCDGQLLPINNNQSLYSLLGTTYGGDGRTTFALPDLRGRSMVHPGSGGGLDTITQGQKAGNIEHLLNVTQIPSHSHTGTVKLGQSIGNTGTGTDNNLAFNTVSDTIFTSSAPTSNNLASDSLQINNTVSNIAFNIRNPYLGLYVCIALQGLFPSRN